MGPKSSKTIILAGSKRRSLSTQGGGLLNRMFGSSSSPTKEHHESPIASHPAGKSASGPGTIPGGLNLDAVNEDGDDDDSRNSLSSPTGRKSQDEMGHNGEKKRRSSGIAKAGALFSSAKNSFHIHNSPNSTPEDSQLVPQPTAMQKLGKTDPALSVPQGPLNNSAGESRPGPRSTFRVGVTEDKNKKCRRTMEDTHAYLYNFLSTPAPNLSSDSESMSSSMKSQLSKDTLKSSSSLSTSPPPSSHVVETDNGYFAIFDGHAGTFAADWCGKKLHVLLEEMIRKNPNTPVPELLDQTFTNVDQQLDKLPLKNSGCTAICAVLRWEDRIPNSNSATGSTAIAPAAAAAVKAASEPPTSDSKSDVAQNSTPQSKASLPGFASATPMPKLQNSASRQRVLYTANVGDARIVLCRNGKALRLSYDHKGSDENEGKRISNAGGLILNNRVNGVLAVTRALGDAYMKDLVTGHPYTTETVIQPDIDEFLILACDGVSLRVNATVRSFANELISCGMFAQTKKPSTLSATPTIPSTLRDYSSIMLWLVSPPTIFPVWLFVLTTVNCSKPLNEKRNLSVSKAIRRPSKQAASARQTPLWERQGGVWVISGTCCTVMSVLKRGPTRTRQGSARRSFGRKRRKK